MFVAKGWKRHLDREQQIEFLNKFVLREKKLCTNDNFEFSMLKLCFAHIYRTYIDVPLC